MVRFEAITTPAPSIQAPMLCFHKHICDRLYGRRLVGWVTDPCRDDDTFVPLAFECIESLQAGFIHISPQNSVRRACGLLDQCRIGFAA